MKLGRAHACATPRGGGWNCQYFFSRGGTVAICLTFVQNDEKVLEIIESLRIRKIGRFFSGEKCIYSVF